MHLLIGKKNYFLFLFVIIFFLSSINNQVFMEKKKSFYDLQSIEVTGLDNNSNFEIQKKLNFLKNTNIFFINKEVLKDQISKYNYIENYNIIKIYPSKIILKLEKAEFLARVIKNNKIFVIGSNSKLINIKKFNNYQNLPMIYGKFTNDKFLLLKKIINKSDLKFNEIKEIFFFPSGRIDIKNKDNVLIKFPIKNLEKALYVAHKILNNKKFNNNIIDLRVPNQLILSNE